MRIEVKRAYAEPAEEDGLRILVDGLWPRGCRKEALRLDGWWREIAPSTALRRWFGHDPARWEEFKERYFAELDGRREVVAALLARVGNGTLTLVYGARDERRNNALALREYLQRRR